MTTTTTTKHEPIVLNDKYRIIDETIQWILEVRRSADGVHNPKYQSIRYCRSRIGLAACVDTLAGNVTPEARRLTEALPDWHVDRDKQAAL
jgi:hypothetical protein